MAIHRKHLELQTAYPQNAVARRRLLPYSPAMSSTEEYAKQPAAERLKRLARTADELAA